MTQLSSLRNQVDICVLLNYGATDRVSEKMGSIWFSDSMHPGGHAHQSAISGCRAPPFVFHECEDALSLHPQSCIFNSTYTSICLPSLSCLL
jgi:hypothetical protein